MQVRGETWRRGASPFDWRSGGSLPRRKARSMSACGAGVVANLRRSTTHPSVCSTTLSATSASWSGALSCTVTVVSRPGASSNL